MENESLAQVSFGLEDLSRVSPKFVPYEGKEDLLVPMFHVVAWQLALTFLHQNSLGRIGKILPRTSELAPYQVVVDDATICIDVKQGNVNKERFEDLSDWQRDLLGYPNKFPLQKMMMIWRMDLSGDERIMYEIVEHFIQFVGSVLVRDRERFERVKQFARDLLIDQPHPCIVLREEIADHYDIRHICQPEQRSSSDACAEQKGG